MKSEIQNTGSPLYETAETAFHTPVISNNGQMVRYPKHWQMVFFKSKESPFVSYNDQLVRYIRQKRDKSALYK